MPEFDLDAFARSMQERAEGERQRRAAMRLPEATTAGGAVFRYIPLKAGDQVQGCPDDWVFACGCHHVFVLLIEARDLTGNARAARMRALGWEPAGDGALWRCPDCVAVWKIVRDG
jgi:hypothetical protein